MSKSPLIELNFFDMEQKNKSSSSSPEPPPTTFRGIQSAISKINPQLLKSLINSSGASIISNEVEEKKSEQNGDFFKNLFPESSSLPIFNPRCSSQITPRSNASPLTIFYNGTVSVFDVSRDKAEILMKLAENKNISKSVESTVVSTSIKEHKSLLEKFNGDDLPIARKKSLHRFLEKRKERMTTVSPYGCVSSPREVKEVGGSSRI